MPTPGHRVFATQTFRVSKVIEAPLKYVYEWCTDYRSDDWTLSKRRPHPSYKVVKLSRRRVLRVRLVSSSKNDPDIAIDLVRLAPPNAWHTNQIDEQDLMALTYRLTAVGAKRTRLDLLVTERWMTPDHPTRAEITDRVKATWDRLAAAVEARYRSRKPAKG